ncbi:sensor histidine kinase [Kaarinaea lacus]
MSIQLQLLFSLLIGTSIFFVTHSTVNEEVDRLTSEIKEQARILADNIASTSGELLLTRDYTALEMLLYGSIRFNNIKRIEVAERSGKVIGSIVRTEDLEPIAQFNQSPLELPNKVEKKIIMAPESEELTAWSPIYLGEHIGWVKIIYKLDQLREVAKRRWTEGIIDGFIYIALVITFILFVLRKPLSTIERYTQFADRLNDNQGNHVEVDRSATELEKLGTALNNASSTVARNTSELRKAFSDLERIAAFAEYSPDIVLSIMQGGYIQYMNPLAIKTLAQLGLKNEEIFLLLPENIMELLTSSIENQTSAREIEVEFKGRTFLWTFAPIVGQKILNCYAMDITRSKKAEEETKQALVDKLSAEQASLAKSRFLANMSHELRTPLNAIIGYSEIIEDEAVDAGYEEISTDLHKIRSAGKHLLSLINEILDLSKIEAGKMDLYVESVDVQKLVTETAETAQAIVAEKGNEFNVTINPEIENIQTDLTKLRQVLYNLISNATKFTENGKIELTVDQYFVQNQRWVSFIVKDSGIGMTEEQKARVFNAFAQADNSTTRRYGGTGLGLAISQTFCQMLGGSISVNSRPDKGSTFYVNLPAGTASEQKKASNE